MPYQHRLRRTVEFAETDMAGIMHFANFFRWMEACETDFYRSLRLPAVTFVPGEVVGWPRVSVSCEFRAPLRFNDTADVRLLIKRIGTRSVTYVFRFTKAGADVARGEITAVCIKSDAKGRMVSAPIPKAVRKKLRVAPAKMLG